MKQISIDSLNAHLFETIEGLKNSKDPNASECEKMDLETAKAISNVGKVIIEGYKVKAQVLGMLTKADNPQIALQASKDSGIIDSEAIVIDKE